MPDSSIVVGARTVADGRSQGFVSAGQHRSDAGRRSSRGQAGERRQNGPPSSPRYLGWRARWCCSILGPTPTAAPSTCWSSVFWEAPTRAPCWVSTEPRVGLLNIGEEESKGSELVQAAHGLLADPTLNFVGNVEGRDLLRNTADVVVTDGFTGNVALKLLEGCASSLFARIKEAAQSGVPREGRGRAAEADPPRPACRARPRGVRRHLPARGAWVGHHLPRQLLTVRPSPMPFVSARRRFGRACCPAWRRAGSAIAGRSGPAAS